MCRYLFVLFMSFLLMFSSCSFKKTKPVIGKQNPIIENQLLSPEVLWAFGRVGNFSLAPDKQRIVYTVTYSSIVQNKYNTDIFTINVDGSDKQQLTETEAYEGSVYWMKDGKHIAYISNKSGSPQLWIMSAKGKKRRQISFCEEAVQAFLFSPDETYVILVRDIRVKPKIAELYPDLPQASGRLIDDLMYKHWDEWVETAPHPFVAKFDGNRLSDEIDILQGEVYESPTKPFGGIEQLAWSHDGTTIAYTCRKKTGKEYAVSTNTAIYFYDLHGGKTTNMTEGMMGYNVNPVFSPDGRYMAWTSMERDGYESDKQRLFIMDIETGDKRDLSTYFDQSAESLAWSADSKTIYFVSVWHAVTQVYSVDIQTDTIKQITKGVHDYQSVQYADNQLIGIKCSMSKPHEIYTIDLQDGSETEISYENKHILEAIEMGKVEEKWIQTTDDKQMHMWVLYPPQFNPERAYPTILYCQGGPQSPVSQFWSYRWNLQLMAANGYIVVAPNRRGLYGFGQEWLEQISGDYGGQNMQDYLSAIDYMSEKPYVDTENLGCVGASYGGFSVFWLAGHHENRFKAFIAHAGIFNLEQQYVETEEMWFANWDMGGPYWDKENEIAQNTYATSPHHFVDKWNTPILVIHGEKDYRILASQGMAAFNAAVLNDVPAQLLVYPDENHWISRPQNSVLWQRTFFAWLDKWLK